MSSEKLADQIVWFANLDQVSTFNMQHFSVRVEDDDVVGDVRINGRLHRRRRRVDVNAAEVLKYVIIRHC